MARRRRWRRARPRARAASRPGVIICGRRPTPGAWVRSARTSGSRAMRSARSAGSPPSARRASSTPTMSRRPCTMRRRSDRPVSTSWHSARIARTSSMGRRGQVAQVARIEQVGEVRGHGASVPPSSGARRPADNVPACDAPSSPSPPSPRSASPLTALRRLRRRRQRLHARRRPSVTVGANDDLTFDADSYEADAGCIEITYDERRQRRPHPADQGQVRLQAGGRRHRQGHRRARRRRATSCTATSPATRPPA